MEELKLAVIFDDPSKKPRKLNIRILSSENGVFNVADDTAISKLKVLGTNSTHKKLTNGRFVKILFPKLDFESKTILVDENSKIFDAPDIEDCLGEVQEGVLQEALDNIPELKNSIKISSFKDAETGKVS